MWGAGYWTTHLPPAFKISWCCDKDEGRWYATKNVAWIRTGEDEASALFSIPYYLGKGFQLESGDSEWQCDVNALCTKEKAEAAATMSRNIWKMFLEAFNWILTFFHTAIFPPQWSKKRFFIPYTNRKYELKQVQGYCMYPFFWTRPFLEQESMQPVSLLFTHWIQMGAFEYDWAMNAVRM